MHHAALDTVARARCCLANSSRQCAEVSDRSHSFRKAVQHMHYALLRPVRAVLALADASAGRLPSAFFTTVHLTSYTWPMTWL